MADWDTLHWRWPVQRRLALTLPAIAPAISAIAPHFAALATP
ncbi:hypothetical protein [Leptolyngbya iicbica]|nr:hypothetical protein [Leptolyngbya sp. LK]